MIDRILYAFFGWLDTVADKIEAVVTFDIGEKLKNKRKKKK